MTTFSEDSRMSIDNNTPLKKEFIGKSWVSMLEDSNSASMETKVEIRIEDADGNVEEEIHDEFLKVKKDLNFENLITRESAADGDKSREIKIDFLDAANEEKFDSLVKQKKLKSPFKRRLSCEKEDEKINQNEMDHKKTKFEHIRENDESRVRTSSSSSGGSSNNAKKTAELETNKSILERRQKQIDYGKNTIGYENYLAQVPVDKRTKLHPRTPPKQFKYSRRAWDGLVRAWRIKLHCFDPESQQNQDSKQEEEAESERSESSDTDQ